MTTSTANGARRRRARLDQHLDIDSRDEVGEMAQALNATIEATRAGEAGKGFAVVANEVKELGAGDGEGDRGRRPPSAGDPG